MEGDQAFGKGGSGYVLAGLLPGPLGHEDRMLRPRSHADRVVRLEESLAGSVGLGAEFGIAAFDSVFAVLDDHDSLTGEDGRRTGLRE